MASSQIGPAAMLRGLWRSFIMVERVLPWVAVDDGRT
jgi:hypothetical protein